MMFKNTFVFGVVLNIEQVVFIKLWKLRQREKKKRGLKNGKIDMALSCRAFDFSAHLPFLFKAKYVNTAMFVSMTTKIRRQ